ncbi:MAG: phosphate signaling complex protein PhoU [Planctomycetota bacterium]
MHDIPDPADGMPLDSAAGLEPCLLQLRRRLLRQAALAIGMLETSLEALWSLDPDLVEEVLRRDDRVDAEEVNLERDCLSLLTLQRPFARDFREITFILKANGDLERVADHACSIAKVARQLRENPPERWPIALREMGERVPMMCHTLLRAVIDEDVKTAETIVTEDKIIDRLDKRVFIEAREMIEVDHTQAEAGMLISRLGRELERVGDLMANIAENVVYLTTGTIVRHDLKATPRLRGA